MHTDTLERAKESADLPALFADLGVKLIKGGTGEYFRARCPFHEDKAPSLSLKRYPDGWGWKCHAGCGQGTVVDFFLMLEQGDVSAAVRRTYQAAGMEPPKGHSGPVGNRPALSPLPTPKPAQPAVKAASEPIEPRWYEELAEAQARLSAAADVPLLARYGVSKGLAGEIGIGLDRDGGLWLPIYGVGGELLTIKKRNPEGLSPRYTSLTAGRGAHPWLSKNFGHTNPAALVVEGEFNAIAAHAALKGRTRHAVIGMPGASSKLGPTANELLGRAVFVYADPDEEGDKARKAWATEAKAAGAAYVAQVPALDSGLEDFAELLRSIGPERMGQYLEQELAELEPTEALPTVDPFGFAELDLSTMPALPEFLVASMIQARKPNILAAYGGVGKSALASHLAACLLSGHRFLGMFTATVDEVMVVDYEDDETPFRLNLIRSCRGLGLDPTQIKSRVKYVAAHSAERFRGRSFAAVCGELADYFAQRPARRLLVVDSFEAAMQIESIKAHEVLTAMSEIKRLCAAGDTTVLLLDHLPKLGKGQSRDDLMPAGSVQKTNQSRSVVKVEDVTPPGYGDGLSLLKFVSIKVNAAKKFEPFGVEREVLPDRVFYRPAELPTQDGTTRGRPSDGSRLVREIILGALADGPRNKLELMSMCESADVTLRTVERVMRELILGGQVDIHQSGGGKGKPSVYKLAEGDE